MALASYLSGVLVGQESGDEPAARPPMPSQVSDVWSSGPGQNFF